MDDIVQPPPTEKNEESVTAPPAQGRAAAPSQAAHPGPERTSTPAVQPLALRRPVGAVTAFDDDAHPVFERPGDGHAPSAAKPLDAAPTLARASRGRPRASLTRVLAAGGAITADDLALLRAWVQGLPASRGGRYLRADGHAGQGARAAREYLKDLLARVAAAAAQLPGQHERALAQRLLAWQPPPAASGQGEPGSQRAAVIAPPARRALPTLEEFAGRFDEDMYSEAELIELYEEEFGGAGSPDSAQESSTTGASALPETARDSAAQAGADANAAPSVAERLAILDQLAPHLEQRPSGRALLAAWLEPELASLLSRSLDAPTLGALAERIAERGRWWWRAVPGLGRVRAERLCEWLAAHGQDIGVVINSRLAGDARTTAATRAGASQAAGPSAVGVPGAAVTTPARPALAPLAQLAWPAQLRGDNGVFRATGVNTLGAADDAQALAAWVRIHVAGKAPATRRVYLRALERLVLWAICERALALSSLASSDFARFRDFLAAPPAHWCGSERVVKGSSAWRPLRGPLSAGAVAQVMGVVQHMWRDWHRSGYLRANAASLVPARALLQPSAICAADGRAAFVGLDVTRAFDDEQLAAIRDELRSMPDGPARRRLRALLLLLLETGLRRAEVQGLTFGALQPLPAGLGAAGDAQLRVVGKRGKLRLVPVRAAVIEALQAHWSDRIALARAGMLPAPILSLREQDAPLLGVLHRVREAGFTGRGDSAAAALRRLNVSGALAGASMHGILKAFFARAAARVAADSARRSFQRASAHWLRHTFAHRVLAAVGEQGLPAAQALLGHASIATTGEYLRAHARERFAALVHVDACL